MASSEDRRVSLENAVAFVTADADSDFSSESGKGERGGRVIWRGNISDNEEHSINPKRCRTRGGLSGWVGE